MPAQQSGSGCGKFLLIGFAVVGIGTALLCLGTGGLMWWGVRQFQPSMDPKVCAEVASSMVDIDVPSELIPKMSMRSESFGMSMVTYDNATQKENLVLVQLRDMKNKGQADAQVSQQGPSSKDFEVTESTTREFTVRGTKTKFTFAKGKNRKTGEDARLVFGEFPGKGGTVALIYFTPPDKYDEARIVKIIESIK